MPDSIHHTPFLLLIRELEDQWSQTSPAIKFLEEQPVVKTEELPEHSQACHICKELFDDPDMDESREPAIKLPCNHIMGYECLKTWFKDSNTCPMCRTLLFRTVSSAGRRSSDVFSSFMAVESELLEIRTLSAENNEHVARLAELNEQTRAEFLQILDRLRAIDALFEQVEVRLQGMVSQMGNFRWESMVQGIMMRSRNCSCNINTTMAWLLNHPCSIFNTPFVWDDGILLNHS